MEENKISYSEKLKDPRWQKKRLQIMDRDGFKCQLCDDEKSTLNVHHKYYIFGRDPWDYNDELLITLCESCHETEENCKDIARDFTKVLLAKGYSNMLLAEFLSVILRLPNSTDAFRIVLYYWYENFSTKDGKEIH